VTLQIEPGAFNPDRGTYPQLYPQLPLPETFVPRTPASSFATASLAGRERDIDYLRVHLQERMVDRVLREARRLEEPHEGGELPEISGSSRTTEC
jgi:hypothetical protein